MVFGSDGTEVSVTEDIIGQFTDEHCKALQGKPKVFIMPVFAVNILRGRSGWGRGERTSTTQRSNILYLFKVTVIKPIKCDTV